MKRIAVLALVMVAFVSVPAFAGSIQENASSSDYLTKAPAMMVRGLSNIVLSPAELFIHTYKGTVEDVPVKGTLMGLGTGAMYMFDRAGRGAWDVLTALAPRYNGAPPTHELEI